METPKITQARLNQYRQELENSATDASDFVRSIVEAYQIAYPEASVTDIKKYTCDAIEDALHVFGGQSCTVANELFEEFAEQAGESVNTQIYDTFDKTYAESKVDYFAQDIVNGNIATFSGNVGAITGFYVKREAFQNMLNNCSKNGIRYARVPSGKETCAFCFMLASRGFVYHTKQSAGEGFGHSYHRHCDCIIVPGFHESTGISADKQIEGYEPSKLYERYKSCLDAVQTPQHTWSADAFNADVRAGKVGADEWEKWKLKRLCAEIDTRDTNWLWTGKVPKVEYEPKEYEGKVKDYEKTTAEILAKQGINCIFRKDVIENVNNSGKNIGLADLKNGFELKTLINKIDNSTVDECIRKSNKKQQIKALVFDNSAELISDEECRDRITNARSCKVPVYLLNNDKYYRIK